MTPRAKKGATPAPAPIPAPAPSVPAAVDAALPAGMGRLDLPRRRAALGGRVDDAVTGRPLAGARVQVVDGPLAWTAWAEARARELAGRTPPGPPPGVTATGADGWFRFLDLPAGRYTVAAALPSAGSRYAAASTTADVTDGHGWADASLALRPTVVEGRVTDADGEPVALADVRVKGSLEGAVTDADGRFRIVAVETGARVVTAGVRGYGPISADVRLAVPGDVAAVDLVLGVP